MTTTPIESVLASLRALGIEAKREGPGWACRCPSHDDANPSLSIGEGDDGRVLLHCFAGCSHADICKSLGLKPADLFVRVNGTPKGARRTGPPKAAPTVHPTLDRAVRAAEWSAKGEHANTWPYHAADGSLAFHVIRIDKPDGDKSFRPVHPVTGGFTFGDPPGDLALYRLPEIAALPKGSRVYVAEGEKCADAARAAGLNATTSAHGAKSAGKSDWTPLAGHDVVLLPDHDENGERYVTEAAGILLTMNQPAASVRVVRLVGVWPEMPKGGDIADLIGEDGPWCEREPDDIRAAIDALADAAEPVNLDAGADGGTGDGGNTGEADPDDDPDEGDDLSELIGDESDSGETVAGDNGTAGTPDTFRAKVLAGIAAQKSKTRSRHLTDLGNAERFAERWTDRVRYCGALGWLGWDGCRWRRDGTNAALRLAGETVKGMYREAAQLKGSKRAGLVAWALKSEDAKHQRAMVGLALAQTPMLVEPSQLDTDGMLFNVENGTIDLRTGELRPHRREDFITKLAPVEYDPAATCPLWLAFLDRTFAGREGLIRYVQRVLGHALTADVSAQHLWVFHGEGGNGKNVLLDTTRGIMGDYATIAPETLLAASKHSREHPTEIADLCGRRFVVGSETEEGDVLRLQLVKRLTGDATLKGRLMRMDYFEFPRTFKTILVTNNKPRVTENTEAAWRRLRLVPFDTVIPEAERDPKLLAKLRIEWPGILAWLVRGCLDWQREGLGEPDEVTIATAAYRTAEDRVERFIDECCEVDPHTPRGTSDLFAPWSVLYRAYGAWCKGNGEMPLGGVRFGKSLDKKGFPPALRRSIEVGGKPAKGRAGLRLLPMPNYGPATDGPDGPEYADNDPGSV